MKNKIPFVLLLLFLLLFSSCGAVDFVSNLFNSNKDTVDRENETHPEWFSFPGDIEISNIVLEKTVILNSYFPEAVVFGPDYFMVKNGSVLQGITGSLPPPAAEGEESGESGYPVEAGALDGKARYGRFEYEIRKSYGTVGVMRFGEPDKKTKETPREDAGILSYEKAGISAGPLVFNSYIIFASDEPSFLVFQRQTRELVSVFPMKHTAAGPLVYMAELGKIAALHLDGTIGIYSLNGEEVAPMKEPGHDPASEYIGLTFDALEEMQNHTEQVMSRDDVAFDMPYVYGPRRNVPPLGAVLYFIPPEKEQIQYRFYVDGTGDKRYFIIIFNEHGEILQTNVGYTVSPWLDMHVPGNMKLFVAAGVFSSPDDPVDENREYTLVLSPPGGVKE